jgi:ABC-2 type transport system permease protein
MKLSVIRKYLRLYWYYIKFSLIISFTYRASFFVEILVDSFYVVWTIFFFEIIYRNTQFLAGWEREELYLLLGIKYIVSDLVFMLTFVWGIRILPERINKGEIDFHLLKPVNSLFQLTTGRPYISGLIGILTGIFLIAYSMTHIDFNFNLISFGMALLIIFCGMLINYSIMVLLTSLTFIFPNAYNLSRIGFYLLDYGILPH